MQLFFGEYIPRFKVAWCGKWPCVRNTVCQCTSSWFMPVSKTIFTTKKVNNNGFYYLFFLLSNTRIIFISYWLFHPSLIALKTHFSCSDLWTISRFSQWHQGLCLASCQKMALPLRLCGSWKWHTYVASSLWATQECRFLNLLLFALHSHQLHTLQLSSLSAEEKKNEGTSAKIHNPYENFCLEVYYSPVAKGYGLKLGEATSRL